MVLTKTDLRYLRSSLDHCYDLTLNYNNERSIDCPISELKRYPYNGASSDRYIYEAHAMYRKLTALIDGTGESPEDEAKNLILQAMSKMGW